MRRVAETLADAFLANGGGVGVANTTTGFRASAVDLGQLQAIINDALAPFNMDHVRERWNEDIGKWLARFLMSWTQRCKEIHFDREGERGIYIRLVTQDDHGYYTYEFDGFAGKRPRGPVRLATQNA